MTTVIFRDAHGRELRTSDLAGVTGTFRWEVVGDSGVTATAKQLHSLARDEGQKGNYKRALELLTQAQKEAPEWPYPVYDKAYTYLLQDDMENATRCYEEVDRMAPRGFFTAKTAVDCLRREKKGEFKAGLYKAYVFLEWADDPKEKRSILDQMVAKYPQFAPAWMELATMLDGEDAKLAAIDHGLSAKPDGETKGILLINKALILERTGDHEKAVQVLGELALDPASTLGTEHLAKLTLSNIMQKK